MSDNRIFFTKKEAEIIKSLVCNELAPFKKEETVVTLSRILAKVEKKLKQLPVEETEDIQS